MLRSSTTQKYGFRIRTRHGLVIDHLKIHGRDEADAERKVRQIYRHCEILERRIMQLATTRRATEKPGETFDEVVSVVSP